MQKTTDNQNELFDIVDENDNVVGQSTRGEVHGNKKLIHRSVGIVVFNSSGEIFLQQRSATKDTDPNLWTISCSGHVISGDSYEITAKRELQEELGVDTGFKLICKYICRASNETEMVILFQASSEGPFRLHPQEIAEGKFMSGKNLKKNYNSGEIKLSYAGITALKKIGWL